MLLISRQSLFSVTDFVDLTASRGECFSDTYTMGKFLCAQSRVVCSEYSVARKTALSTPSPSAKVCPAIILRITLVILFDCQHIGENCPSLPISTIKCPPCVPPSGRFPIQELLNTTIVRKLFSPKYINFKVTFSDFSFLISLFAQCGVCVLDAKMDMSHIMAVPVCLDTHQC